MHPAPHGTRPHARRRLKPLSATNPVSSRAEDLLRPQHQSLTVAPRRGRHSACYCLSRKRVHTVLVSRRIFLSGKKRHLESAIRKQRRRESVARDSDLTSAQDESPLCAIQAFGGTGLPAVVMPVGTSLRSLAVRFMSGSSFPRGTSGWTQLAGLGGPANCRSPLRSVPRSRQSQPEVSARSLGPKCRPNSLPGSAREIGFVFQLAGRRMTGFVFSNDSATPGWVRFFKLLCDANVASFFQLAGRRMRGFVFSNNSATRTWVRFFKIAPRRQIGFERAKSPTTNSTSRAAAYSASGSPESRSPSYRPSSAGSST